MMNINPVLLKELKVRMRGWRAAGIVVLYLSIMALVAVLIVYTSYMSPYSSSIDPQAAIGTYTGLAVIQFILIMFIVPALTAGAISGEREKQTLDLVLSTRLSPRSIIIGKLLASMSQIVLLIVASLPIFSMVFLFGGISVRDMLQLFGFYLATAVAVGSIGVFFSTYFKRTTASTVLTYGAVAMLAFGTILVALFYIRIFYQLNYQKYFPLLYANPLAGFSSLIASQYGTGGGVNILPGFYVTNPAGMKGPAPWVINIIFDLVLSVILLIFASIRINPLRKGLLSLLRGRKKPVQTR